MDSNQFMGALVFALAGLIGLIFTVTKPLLSVHKQLVELNTNQKMIIEQNKIRDDRISTHGKEIEDNQKELVEVKHELANHEGRIKSLENWRQMM